MTYPQVLGRPPSQYSGLGNTQVKRVNYSKEGGQITFGEGRGRAAHISAFDGAVSLHQLLTHVQRDFVAAAGNGFDQGVAGFNDADCPRGVAPRPLVPGGQEDFV